MQKYKLEMEIQILVLIKGNNIKTENYAYNNSITYIYHTSFPKNEKIPYICIVVVD